MFFWDFSSLHFIWKNLQRMLILVFDTKLHTFKFFKHHVCARFRLVLLFYYFLSLIGRLVNILLWFGIQSFPHYQTIKKSMTAWDILTHSNLDLNYGHATYLATLFPPEFFSSVYPPWTHSLKSKFTVRYVFLVEFYFFQSNYLVSCFFLSPLDWKSKT